MAVHIHNADQLSDFELITVFEDLKQRGIDDYTIRPGNNCIWVSYQRVDSYYIFRDGRLFDIQFD